MYYIKIYNLDSQYYLDLNEVMHEPTSCGGEMCRQDRMIKAEGRWSGRNSTCVTTNKLNSCKFRKQIHFFSNNFLGGYNWHKINFTYLKGTITTLHRYTLMKPSPHRSWCTYLSSLRISFWPFVSLRSPLNFYFLVFFNLFGETNSSAAPGENLGLSLELFLGNKKNLNSHLKSQNIFSIYKLRSLILYSNEFSNLNLQLWFFSFSHLGSAAEGQASVRKWGTGGHFFFSHPVFFFFSPLLLCMPLGLEHSDPQGREAREFWCEWSCWVRAPTVGFSRNFHPTLIAGGLHLQPSWWRAPFQLVVYFHRLLTLDGVPCLFLLRSFHPFPSGLLGNTWDDPMQAFSHMGPHGILPSLFIQIGRGYPKCSSLSFVLPCEQLAGDNNYFHRFIRHAHKSPPIPCPENTY